MTIYIVVEGVVGEARVYEKWVSFVNPNLRFVPHVSDITDNSFCIVSGGGHPSYYDVIEAAISDVINYGINRLIQTQ